MSEPRRFGSDLDVIPGTPIAADLGTPPGPTDPAKGRYVIGLLDAAGLKFPWGADIGHAEVMWSEMLSPFSPEVLERAVVAWVESDTHDFPAVGELRSVADMLVREERREAALARGRKSVRHNQVCPECYPGYRDTDEAILARAELENTSEENAPGLVPMDDSEYGIGVSRPCSLCRPEQHKAWEAGCFKKNHRGCKLCQPKRRS